MKDNSLGQGAYIARRCGAKVYVCFLRTVSHQFLQKSYDVKH